MATFIIAESFDMGGGWGVLSGANGEHPTWRKEMSAAAGDYTCTAQVAPAYNTSIKHSGAGSLRCSRGAAVSDYLLYQPITSNWGAFLSVSYWVYVPTGGIVSGQTNNQCQISGPTTGALIKLEYSLAGTLSLTLNSTGLKTIIAFDTWYHVELTYDGALHTLYVNGVPNTGTAAATGNVTSLQIGSYNLTKTAADLYIDELLVSTTHRLTYAEAWTVRACMPDADDGTDSAFTPSTGTVSWSLLDEVPPLGVGADYVTSTAINQNELWGIDAAAVPANSVVAAVKAGLHVTPVGGTDLTDHFIRVNDGSAYNTAMTSGLSTTATYQYHKMYNTPPSGGAWTPTNVESLKIGCAKGSVALPGTTINVNQGFAEVVWRYSTVPVSWMKRARTLPPPPVTYPAVRRVFMPAAPVATSPLPVAFLRQRTMRTLAPLPSYRTPKPFAALLTAPVVVASTRRPQSWVI